MDKIPRPVLGEVCKFLELKEIFISFVLVSKKCRDVVEDERYLIPIFLNSFNILKNLQIDKPSILNILRRLEDRNYLEFVGFGTTGGCQDNMVSYWVGNLYDARDQKFPYPSARNRLNTNTAGVLAITQEAHKKKYDLMIKELYEEVFNEEYTFSEEDMRLINAKFEKDKNTDTDAMGIPLRAKMNRLIKERNFQLDSLQEIRRRPDDRFILVYPIDFESADSMEKFFIIKKVLFRRPLHFTCPVETFMVFISETYVDIESQEFLNYNDLLTPESLEPFKTTFNISDLQESQGVSYRTFMNKKDKDRNSLKPILWGKFSRNAETFELELEEYFSGAYLYTKLINPDNRNLEFGYAREEFNIDASRVRVEGLEIRI